ncbi:ParA family protein [Ralstonia pseudosolanacearum]|uniref:ParA family protein n=1 Tax=Ralstonia pseudosolanacearum TaxID=1310165 RepID=UPI003CF123C9
MTTSLALFNHKGGVGKTTLTVNLARAFGQLGLRTLVVDADPQCNATAFYLNEDQVDQLLSDSVDPEEGGTIWSGIARYARSRGEVRSIAPYDLGGCVFLLPGDVILGTFEDKLSSAWKSSFSRDEASIDLMSAIFRSVSMTAEEYEIDVILYDVGPSVGSLNRALLLGTDFFAVPVGCDLFSLRALGTLGQTLESWIRDWETVKGLASTMSDVTLLPGAPTFVGYMTQHFNIYRGRSSSAFETWENKIAPRVTKNVVGPLQALNGGLAPDLGPKKIGEVPAFHSLAPLSQEHGVPIGGLKGRNGVNNGYSTKISEADELFRRMAKELAKRMGVMPQMNA